MRLDQMRYRARGFFHRILCRFGWHIGANLPWEEEGRYYSRCMWCNSEFQLIGGDWRPYIRPPRLVWNAKGSNTNQGEPNA